MLEYTEYFPSLSPFVVLIVYIIIAFYLFYRIDAYFMDPVELNAFSEEIWKPFLKNQDCEPGRELTQVALLTMEVGLYLKIIIIIINQW